MKKILLLFFLSFKLVFSVETLSTGNGKLAAEIVKSNGGIRIKNEIKSKDFNIKSLDIAVAVDGIIYPVKNGVRNISYIEGTNILKAFVSDEKFNMSIYYVPSMVEKEFFHISCEVESKFDAEELEVLYYINPGQEIGFVNRSSGGFKYGGFSFLNMGGKELFFSDDEDIFIPKLKLVSDVRKKYTDDRFLIVDKLDLNDGTLKSQLTCGFSDLDNDSEGLVLEKEFSYWNTFSGKIQNVPKNTTIQQQLVFLTTLQLDSGEVASNYVNGSFGNIENTLYAVTAFTKYSLYEEAEKGINFLVERKGIGMYAESFLFYVIGEYLARTGDFGFFYELKNRLETLSAYSRMRDLAHGKLKAEGLDEIGTDYYLYLAMESLHGLGLEEFKEFSSPHLDLMIDFNLRYLNGDELLADVSDATAFGDNILYIGVLPRKKRLEILEKHLRSGIEESSIEERVDLLWQVYKDGVSDRSWESILAGLNAYIKEGDLIISEDRTGRLNSRIASKYLLMMHKRGI